LDVFIFGVAILTTLTIFGSAVSADHLPPDANWLTVIYNQFIYAVLPIIGIIAFVGGFFIILVMPPAALFSFLYARKTTARIDKLANAARALEQGHLETRVTIEGEDEVAQLQGSFNSMASQIQQTLTELQIERDKVTVLLKSRQDLVAGVSHELRTPVAVIRGYTENLLAPDPARTEETSQQQLEIMEKEILRLQALLDDLFTLSRVEVGKLTINCRPLNLADSVNQAVKTFAPIAWQTRRVEISAQLPTDLPPVNADESRLAQILTNLIRNAIRYTSPGGLVLLSAASESRFVRLDVRDTGEGIAPEVLDHIWERYYQAPDAQNNEQTDSVGIGLALVKELTEAMQGSVSVASTVGEGSCFSIFLPCA
ncbi:MAG: ATP-binding protein, partial [Anaerolineaceae bacterium]